MINKLCFIHHYTYYARIVFVSAVFGHIVFDFVFVRIVCGSEDFKYIITVGRSSKKGDRIVQFNKKCNSIIVWYRVLVVKFWNNQLLALNRLHYMNYCEMVGISRPDSLVGEGVRGIRSMNPIHSTLTCMPVRVTFVVG